MKLTDAQYEKTAEHIFDAMADAARTGEPPQPWHPGGNSDMQKRARECARQILSHHNLGHIFPNPLQVTMGAGTVLLRVGHETDGSGAILTFEDTGVPRPIGQKPTPEQAKELGINKPFGPGQVILYFRNIESARAVQTTMDELVTEWLIPSSDSHAPAHWPASDAPIPGPGGDGRAFAPFTESQIEKLHEWQACDWGHALEHCSVPMTVHTDGLHCAVCNIVQGWVPKVCLRSAPPEPRLNPAWEKASHEMDRTGIIVPRKPTDPPGEPSGGVF